jgi:hypothetical protein
MVVMVVKNTDTQQRNTSYLTNPAQQQAIFALFRDVGYFYEKKSGSTPCRGDNQKWQTQLLALKQLSHRAKNTDAFVKCGFRYARQAIFCSLDRVWHRHEYRTTGVQGLCKPEKPGGRHARPPCPSNPDHEYEILVRMHQGEQILHLIRETIPPGMTIAPYTRPQFDAQIGKLFQLRDLILKMSVINPKVGYWNVNSARRTEGSHINPYLQGRLNAAFGVMYTSMPRFPLGGATRSTTKSPYENIDATCTAATQARAPDPGLALGRKPATATFANYLQSAPKRQYGRR